MLNKKKTGIIVLGLAALSLGTIGFSSWIINAINGEASSEVNVTVGDVVDNSLTIDNVTTTDSKLNFDAKKGVSGEVISADPNGEDEDLTFEFSFSIHAATEKIYNAAISNKKVYLSFDSTNTEFKNVVKEKHILSPFAIDGATYEEKGITSLATNTESEKSVTYTDPSGASKITRLTYLIEDYTAGGMRGKTVTLTYSFAWGEVFKFENPVELSSGDFSANDNAAKTALDAIDKIDDTDLKLNVTLTVK